jgi:hypothetical protein
VFLAMAAPFVAGARTSSRSAWSRVVDGSP